MSRILPLLLLALVAIVAACSRDTPTAVSSEDGPRLECRSGYLIALGRSEPSDTSCVASDE